jgi:peptidoglycan hydrolase-like protein with peptidoglycan-binding domain
MLGIVGFAIAETIPASAAGEQLIVTETPAVRVTETLAALDAAPSDSPSELPLVQIKRDSAGELIQALETRLRWAGSLKVAPDSQWSNATTVAIRNFQSKNRLTPTGDATRSTIRRLNIVASTPRLDARCYSKGIRICVSKQQKVARYLRDGKVLREFDVNIGPEKGDPKYGQYSSTREGVNQIGEKSVDAVSSLYGYSMPYWMQFDGGIGFHYSAYFNQIGYGDTSMGCVTIGDRPTAQWLFENSPTKTTVIVY